LTIFAAIRRASSFFMSSLLAVAYAGRMQGAAKNSKPSAMLKPANF
jgi:hypothetical protein